MSEHQGETREGEPLDPREWEETRVSDVPQRPPSAYSPDEDVPDNIREQTRQGEDPYQWHSGRTREHGQADAVEFIDVKKSFGRNTILNGLNLGLPDDQISMILGPSGTGKSVCIKHMVGPALPRRGRRAGARRVGAEPGRRRAVRDAQEVRRPLPGRRALRIDERVRQHRLPAPPAHRQGRRGDQGDRGPAARRGGPDERSRQDAQRALRRHAQAGRLRPGAGAGPGHRALRRARLRASTRCARRSCAS